MVYVFYNRKTMVWRKSWKQLQLYYFILYYIQMYPYILKNKTLLKKKIIITNMIKT